MATYPDKPRSAFLDWCRAHTGVFTDHAVAIGLTAEQALAFRNASSAADASLPSLEAARQEAKVATRATDDAFGALRKSAGDVVRLIRAFAESSDKPLDVYQLAQIPPPARPSPAPPPAQPGDLRVALDPSEGHVTLQWKASNPRGTSGTSYLVRRRRPGEAGFAFLGVSGRKSFVDTTLPAGVESVQYTVQGQRADASGPVSPIFIVHFGRAAGGALTARVTTAGAPARHAATADAATTAHAAGNGHALREMARV